MKPQTIADAIFAVAIGVLACAAVLHWALTCNVVGA
jgi:hypothetical protein